MGGTRINSLISSVMKEQQQIPKDNFVDQISNFLKIIW